MFDRSAGRCAVLSIFGPGGGGRWLERFSWSGVRFGLLLYLPRLIVCRLAIPRTRRNPSTLWQSPWLITCRLAPLLALMVYRASQMLAYVGTSCY